MHNLLASHYKLLAGLVGRASRAALFVFCFQQFLRRTLQDANMATCSSAGGQLSAEGLGVRQVRRVYLITYSHVDTSKGQDFRTAPYIYYAYSSLFIENNEQNNRAPLGLKRFVSVISLF